MEYGFNFKCFRIGFEEMCIFTKCFVSFTFFFFFLSAIIWRTFENKTIQKKKNPWPRTVQYTLLTGNSRPPSGASLKPSYCSDTLLKLIGGFYRGACRAARPKVKVQLLKSFLHSSSKTKHSTATIFIYKRHGSVMFRGEEKVQSWRVLKHIADCVDLAERKRSQNSSPSRRSCSIQNGEQVLSSSF